MFAFFFIQLNAMKQLARMWSAFSIVNKTLLTLFSHTNGGTLVVQIIQDVWVCSRIL